MNTLKSLPLARLVNVVALLAAAGGIVVQVLAGVDYPTIPPGPFILVAAAGLVALGPWRWGRIAAIAVPAFVLIGGTIAFIAGGVIRDSLADPGDIAPFVGTIVQLVALAIALAAGIAATRTGPATEA